MDRGRNVRTVRILVVVLAVAFVGIQLVPVDRENPAATLEVPAPDDVRAVLKRSCYDCHSNQTRWPWYAYVAPLSWFVADHVEGGRDHLNFSMWNAYSQEQRDHRLDKMVEEIEEGQMPLDEYLLLHPTARVSDAELALLSEWVTGMTGEEADSD